jgi:Trp operon repressor
MCSHSVERKCELELIRGRFAAGEAGKSDDFTLLIHQDAFLGIRNNIIKDVLNNDFPQRNVKPKEAHCRAQSDYQFCHVLVFPDE